MSDSVGYWTVNNFEDWSQLTPSESLFEEWTRVRQDSETLLGGWADAMRYWNTAGHRHQGGDLYTWLMNQPHPNPPPPKPEPEPQPEKPAETLPRFGYRFNT